MRCAIYWQCIHRGVFRPAGHADVRGASGASIRHFLIPDLAGAAFLITLFYCLFLFAGYQKLFRDSDAGWHIRTGESILSNRSLPRADTYSFTRAGQPWFAWEWGADVLMGGAHQVAGLGGVAFVYALAIGVSVWLWFRLNWIIIDPAAKSRPQVFRRRQSARDRGIRNRQ